KLNVGLLHIRPYADALVQSHIRQKTAIAVIAIGQGGIAYRIKQRQLQIAEFIRSLRWWYVHKGFSLCQYVNAGLPVLIVIMVPASDQQCRQRRATGGKGGQPAPGAVQPDAVFTRQVRLSQQDFREEAASKI